MIPIPIRLKQLVPGYRAKWRSRYHALLAHCHAHVARLTFGTTDGTPWLELDNGPRLHGFATEPKNAEIFALLRADLPAALPETHFRLVKDYINRYVYPHMRPDLKPAAPSNRHLFGFHGQHKDAIADLDDAEARARLNTAFAPKPDDVVIDCGAFLGFGEAHMAPLLENGHLYALEANHDCFTLLTRNMAHNRFDNVTPVHRAVWDTITELDLETGFAQANSLVKEVYTGTSTQPVTTTTIDKLVSDYGLTRLDMLSLTLNGGEVEALKGATETLSKLRPRIRLAGWYKRGGVPIWQLTRAQLEPWGYDIFVGYHGNLMALPSNR